MNPFPAATLGGWMSGILPSRYTDSVCTYMEGAGRIASCPHSATISTVVTREALWEGKNRVSLSLSSGGTVTGEYVRTLASSETVSAAGIGLILFVSQQYHTKPGVHDHSTRRMRSSNCSVSMTEQTDRYRRALSPKE